MREEAQRQRNSIPLHVAIIMDGNGRWAKKRGWPRIAGHQAGMNRIKEIALKADELGVRYLTLYAFSTENWKRPKDEVHFLMGLPREFLLKELDELKARRVKVQWFGDARHMPQSTLQAIQQGVEDTQENNGLTLNFALNYGSRAELTRVVQEIAQDVQCGRLETSQITEQEIERRLYSSGIPDPDLLIRTSGEMRLSNFMLWQLAYAELYFSEALWPDFTAEEFVKVVAAYQTRARRYGSV